ncbi:MAG: hypothetical protein Q9160_002284 [Pyrenula sp. 1 TL-2023]
MRAYDRGNRRLYLYAAFVGALILLFYATVVNRDDGSPSRFPKIPVPHGPTFSDPESDPGPPPPWMDGSDFEQTTEVIDQHPIADLMHEANQKWQEYEAGISTTFRDTVKKYRNKYGRHPPPGFKEWYRFARKRNVHNIDDFEQIMDDIRPFWALEPKYIRALAAHMWEKEADGVAGIHIRNHKVEKLTNPSWRSENLAKVIEVFVDQLPDMDIAMNRLDQPRTIVPWEEMQKHLSKELETRSEPPEVMDSFTSHSNLLNLATDIEHDNSTRQDPAWFGHAGKPYMEIASLACPPESPARNKSMSEAGADALYKIQDGGLVSNFNRSSDLCTVGPVMGHQHGFLFTASSITASHKLLPVFGECKVNVNSDILFPANMYYLTDKRYDYSADVEEHEVDWEDKKSSLFWRGVTSGGVQNQDTWQTMHRQRLVRLVNGTFIDYEGKEVSVLTEAPLPPQDSSSKPTYQSFGTFHPAHFASEHTDVGFTEAWGCVPNCSSIYDEIFSYKPEVPLSESFNFKYLIDVDGHSFSGRWRAFLYGKSLGFKATIFREWHDSRLFAWRHFVPVDNRYDDLYTLLMYFIGYGKPGNQRVESDDYGNGDVYVPSHDFEGKKIARSGREWAKKVLRREDIEVYMFRLLLEYARVSDDNRGRIGYSGYGSELDKFDDEEAETPSAGSRWGLGGIGSLVSGGKKNKEG